MALHLLINGLSFCRWTASPAGQTDALEVTLRLGVECRCGVERWDDAREMSLAWKHIHPRHKVAVGLGPCTELEN